MDGDTEMHAYDERPLRCLRDPPLGGPGEDDDGRQRSPAAAAIWLDAHRRRRGVEVTASSLPAFSFSLDLFFCFPAIRMARGVAAHVFIAP